MTEVRHAGRPLDRPLPLLALGALGVVFGDIGTSPLYAIRESFEGGGHELAVNDERVLGILSLVFWSLIIVVSLKYLVFVLRADHEGEGGILGKPVHRTAGASAYLFSTPGYAPPALLANLRHYDVLSEVVLVISIVTDDVPRVHPVRRIEVSSLGAGFFEVVVHVGFMEAPDVHRAMIDRAVPKIGFDPDTITYFLGREALRVTDREGMAAWRERLFAVMARNATPAANFFGLPADQTIEVGIQVEL